MLSNITNLLTHSVTITDEIQVGTEEDDFGGVQPIYETVTLYDDKARYEANGEGLSREFLGERDEDDPVLILKGKEATTVPDDVEDYDPEGVVFDEDATLEIDHLDGTFEITQIEPYYLNSPDPQLVLVNPVRVD